LGDFKFKAAGRKRSKALRDTGYRLKAEEMDSNIITATEFCSFYTQRNCSLCRSPLSNIA